MRNVPACATNVLVVNCVDGSDPECVDQNCEGTLAAQQATEELAALTSLALELKTIVR
jgi:hypothetical protein